MAQDSGFTRAALLTEKQVAAMLSMKEQTLRNWRCARRSQLPFIKVGRLVRYRIEDVEEWLRQCTVPGQAFPYQDI